MKARILVSLENADRSKCCSRCGDRGPLRLLEMNTGITQTEIRAICIPCSDPILEESTGDPRE